ncbi:reverse transcriptase domain-containing protein [Tanacetum coccineum]
MTHMVKGVTKKREKTFDTQSGEKKKEEKPALEKTSILMVSGRDHRLKKRPGSNNGTGEITFPPIPNKGSSDPVVIKVYISGRQVNRAYLDSGSSCEVIYEHCFLKLKRSIRSLRVDSNTPLVGFSGEESWPLGEVPLEVTIREGPLMITKTLTFVIVRSDSPHNLLLRRTAMQEMGIVVSTVHGAIKSHTPNGVESHHRETITNKDKNAAARSPKSARRRFCMDYSPHNRSAENINYRRRNLQHRTSAECVQSHRTSKTKEEKPGPERNEAVRTQVEELVEAGVLREVKY